MGLIMIGFMLIMVGGISGAGLNTKIYDIQPSYKMLMSLFLTWPNIAVTIGVAVMFFGLGVWVSEGPSALGLFR